MSSFGRYHQEHSGRALVKALRYSGLIQVVFHFYWFKIVFESFRREPIYMHKYGTAPFLFTQ